MSIDGPDPAPPGSAPPEVTSAANIALVLETVFGLFGILGIGHVYSGRIALGVGLLLGWWAYIVVAFLLGLVTMGILGCLLAPIYIAVPIVSGIYARAYVLSSRSTGSWGPVAYVAVGGCLVMAVAFLAVILGLGAVAALISVSQPR